MTKNKFYKLSLIAAFSVFMTFFASSTLHAEELGNGLNSDNVLSYPDTTMAAPIKKRPVTQLATPNDTDYKLKAGDHLRIFVFGVEDLSGEFRLDSEGRITMPLIGEVKASGLDKIRLQNLITSKLINGDYFNDPKVTVEILALTPFYILGEVRNPGSYEYQPDLDLFKAIAIAGGYTTRAVKSHATIIRKVNGKKIRMNATEDTELLPGDSIKVKQRFF